MGRMPDGVITSVDELRHYIRKELRVSDWHEVTQDRIDKFADATGDHQWIHVDPERAKDGPFGTTIAHGYLTMSLAPMLLSEVWRVEGMKMGLNYGINKLRFPSPVPVGSKLRVGATLASVEDVGGGGVQATLALAFEIERNDMPACVAEGLYRYYA